MSDFNINVGMRIRTLRENLGYTREKLADIAKINDKFLYEVETGKKGLSAENILKLSRALNVSTDYLLKGNGKPTNHEIIIELLNNFDCSELRILENVVKEIFTISKKMMD